VDSQDSFGDRNEDDKNNDIATADRDIESGDKNTTAAASAEEGKLDKRVKKKKAMSMYGSAMHAMGMAPAKIEHAQEVQLFTSDQKPAGKVSVVSLSCLHCADLFSLLFHVVAPQKMSLSC
jgi:hypothetical protein